MTITIIACVAANGIIGRGGSLPWYIPEETQFFKQMTTGHTCIIGKNTWKDIWETNGKPLENRLNIVLSSNPFYILHYPSSTNLKQACTLEAAIALAPIDKEIYIIGGYRPYREAFQLADKLIITHLEKAFPGHVYFPEVDNKSWMVDNTEQLKYGHRNYYSRIK